MRSGSSLRTSVRSACGNALWNRRTSQAPPSSRYRRGSTRRSLQPRSSSTSPDRTFGTAMRGHQPTAASAASHEIRSRRAESPRGSTLVGPRDVSRQTVQAADLEEEEVPAPNGVARRGGTGPGEAATSRSARVDLPVPSGPARQTTRPVGRTMRRARRATWKRASSTSLPGRRRCLEVERRTSASAGPGSRALESASASLLPAGPKTSLLRLSAAAPAPPSTPAAAAPIVVVANALHGSLASQLAGAIPGVERGDPASRYAESRLCAGPVARDPNGGRRRRPADETAGEDLAR